MPLDYSNSKASVGNNIKAEMTADKPQKQAIAIAESVKRRGKPKSMKADINNHIHKLRNDLR